VFLRVDFGLHSLRSSRTVFLQHAPRALETLLRGYAKDLQQLDSPYLCLFIEMGSKHVLIDTGFGVEGFGAAKGRLLQNLRAEGIEPEHVDTVILSNGHLDYIGGNADSEGRPVFPNARYVMYKAEWDYWMTNPSLDELPIGQDFKYAILRFAR